MCLQKKTRKAHISVIPAQAGIQEVQTVTNHWIPAFAGMTTFCESIINYFMVGMANSAPFCSTPGQRLVTVFIRV